MTVAVQGNVLDEGVTAVVTARGCTDVRVGRKGSYASRCGWRVGKDTCAVVVTEATVATSGTLGAYR